MLLGGRILLVCAAISPKMGTATKENGDCPYPGRVKPIYRWANIIPRLHQKFLQDTVVSHSIIKINSC